MKLLSQEVELKFLKTDDKAWLPLRNHTDTKEMCSFGERVYCGTGDTGYDIHSIEGCIVPAKGSCIVPVGFKVAFITPGFWFKIESRSGLSFKHGVIAHPGIIDNQYRGDMGIKLYNLSNIDYNIKIHDKIAQLVVYPILSPIISWTAKTHETVRGEKGFGASGK